MILHIAHKKGSEPKFVQLNKMNKHFKQIPTNHHEKA